MSTFIITTKPFLAGLFAMLLGLLSSNAAYGQIFITNFVNGTISEYSFDGSVVNGSLVSGLSSPASLAILGSNLLVANYATVSDEVGEYTISGDTINASFIIGLSNPQGIAISASNIFVTNDGNNKLGEYTTTGATTDASLITGLNHPSATILKMRSANTRLRARRSMRR